MKKRRIKPQIKTLALAGIRAAEYNPRTISEEALAGLAASMEKFGCVEPIIVNTRGGRNTIIGGHQRFKVLQQQKQKTAACVCVDLSKREEKMLNLALNNPAIQGEFIAGIGEYIDRLSAELGDDKELLELRIDQLRGELGKNEKIGLTDDDAVPKPPKKPRTKPGNIWQLGRHRLLCGDSTTSETVKKLLRGTKADLVITDPPYNMNYKPKKLGRIENDNMSQAEFVKFVLSSATIIKSTLRSGGSYYICMSSADYPLVYYQLRKLGLAGRQIIWAKPSIGMGSQEYRPQYEVIFYGYIGSREKRIWNGQRHESDLWLCDGQNGIIARVTKPGMTIEMGDGIDTVQIVLNKKVNGTVIQFDGGACDLWRFGRAEGDYVHPTQKPIALITRAMVNSSREKNIVFDGFCGSGTTIIAAEKLGRRCYAIELDPVYCDVTVKRWEQWTGKRAKLVKK